MSFLSSREFNQDVGRAKRAAKSAPVIITERGKPSYVLLSYEDFQKLSGPAPDMVAQLGMAEGDFDFEPDTLTLVTRNVKDFESTGVAVLNVLEG